MRKVIASVIFFELCSSLILHAVPEELLRNIPTHCPLERTQASVCARARMGVCVLIMCNLGLQIASEHLKLSNVGIAFDRVGATANNPNIAWNVS